MSLNSKISIDELVANDIRKAEVLRNYGIDFCCRGKRSLELACQEKGIDAKVIIEEINQIRDYSRDSLRDSIKWSLDLLIEYILVYHHFYLKQELPQIEKLLDKLVEKHGDKHPQLIDLAKYFASLKSESELHMGNEEQTLFPYVDELLMIQEGRKEMTPLGPGGIETTIKIMRMEHDTSDDILRNIRILCQDYVPTEYICDSHRLVLQKLQDLEKDLYQHYYLENNILFPKALKLEKEIISR